nr:uncharacterized protein LOC116285888 [Vicugna pacos]
MTWFSRAAPSAADPKGGAATPAREGGGAGRTKRSLERGGSLASAGRGTRSASAPVAALKVWAVPRGRCAREKARVEQGPNWSEELNKELWRQPQRAESATTARAVNKRVETVPNHSAQKWGKRTNGRREYMALILASLRRRLYRVLRLAVPAVGSWKTRARAGRLTRGEGLCIKWMTACKAEPPQGVFVSALLKATFCRDWPGALENTIWYQRCGDTQSTGSSPQRQDWMGSSHNHSGGCAWRRHSGKFDFLTEKKCS